MLRKIVIGFITIATLVWSCDDPVETEQSSPAEELPSFHERYKTLRYNALEIDPAEAGINVTSNDEVFAVLIEETNNNVTSSLFVTKNGNASLYVSNGGGIIGGISDPSSKNNAIKLVQQAGEIFSNFERADAYPVPKNGYIRFYFVTSEFVHTLEDETSVIMGRYPELHQLRLTAKFVLEGLYKIKKEQKSAS